MTLPPVTPPAFSRNRFFRSPHCALFRALLIGTAIGASVSMAVPARAQSAVESSHTWNIPAGPLDTALARFAAEAGVNLSFEAQLVAGRHSAGVSGEHTVASALARLLDGTGLEAERGAAGVFRLRRVSGEVAVLPAVKVQVAGAQRDELPEAYAGGQVARGSKVGLLGNKDMMDTPFSQTSYTSQLIQNQQARSVGDVLQNDPSIRANRTSDSGGVNVNIRGFFGGDTAFGGLFGIAPGGMAPEAYERIEVLKGPSALLSGMSPDGWTIGGTVNVVPKRAEDVPVKQLTATHTSDSQFGGHVDLGQRFGSDNQFGVRFNAVQRDGDTAIDHQQQKTQLAAVALDFRGEAARLTADLGWERVRTDGPRNILDMTPGFSVPRAPRNTVNYMSSWEFSDNATSYGLLRGEVDFADNFTAFAAVGGKRLRAENAGTRVQLQNEQGDIRISRANAQNYRSDATSMEAGVRGTVSTGSVSHALSLVHTGLQAETGFDSRSFNLADFPQSNIYRPVYSPAPDLSGLIASGSTPKSGEAQLSSLALADTMSFMDDRVQLTLGLRRQSVESESFNTATGARTSRYDESATTGAVTLLLKPLPDLSVYGNYIEGLQRGSVAPATADNAGEIFPPFVSKQYEIGVKRDFGHLTTTLAAYQITFPSAFTDPATNRFGVEGEVRHRGLEFSAFGKLREDTRVLGGLQYLDSVQTRTLGGVNQGNTDWGASDVQANINIEWDTFFLRDLTLTARGTYTSSQYVDKANLQKIPAWTSVDLGARYAMKAGSVPVVIRATVQNVFDKSYWSQGFSQLSVSTPRTLSLSATFDF